MEKKSKKNWTQWIYWFTFAVAVIAVYKTLDNFTDIMSWIQQLISIIMPFLMGILVAYLFYIPSRKFENLYKKIRTPKRLARVLSVFTVYIIALLLIILIINVILPAVSDSVVELTNNIPTYYESIINYINDLPDDFIISKDVIKDAAKKVQEIDFTQFFSAEKIIEYIKGVVGIAQGLFSVFVTIIMSIYILLERTEIVNFMQKLAGAIFNKETCKTLGKYFTKTNEVFFKFISSQILDGIVVGIITSIAMLIMNVKYAVLLGFMIGLFNIIPYFGAIIAVGLAILITVFTGGITQAIWVAVIVIILQQIDANIINPKIIGDSLQLSPILVIFAVTVGGAYFGVLGMFLGVPIITVMKLIICDYVDYKNSIKSIENK